MSSIIAYSGALYDQVFDVWWRRWNN